jgi:hypothetical protein
MTAAKRAASGGLAPSRARGGTPCPDWAGELGGTAPEALQQIARPPRWTRHQEKATGPLAPDHPHAEGPWPCQTDPGWKNNPVFEFVRDEEPDWAWDEAPDGCEPRPWLRPRSAGRARGTAPVPRATRHCARR